MLFYVNLLLFARLLLVYLLILLRSIALLIFSLLIFLDLPFYFIFYLSYRPAILLLLNWLGVTPLFLLLIRDFDKEFDLFPLLLALETSWWNYKLSATLCLKSLYVIFPLIKALPIGTINCICYTHFYPALTTVYNCY